MNKKELSILKELLHNSRASKKEIGKNTRLSREVVDYHIKQLEKKGIILGYEARVNLNYFSNQTYHMVIKLRNKGLKDEIAEFIKSLKYTHFVGIMSGNWDLLLGFTTKKLHDLEVYIESLYEKYGPDIQEYELITELKEIKDDFSCILDPTNFTSKVSKTDVEHKMKLDDIDRKLLKHLTPNANLSAVNLAVEFKMSSVAIAKRIKNLVENEVILNFRIIMNLPVLGYELNYIFFSIKNPNPTNNKSVEKELIANPNIPFATKFIGKYSYMCLICSKGTQEYAKILDELLMKLPEVTYLETITFVKQVEHTYIPEGFLDE